MNYWRELVNYCLLHITGLTFIIVLIGLILTFISVVFSWILRQKRIVRFGTSSEPWSAWEARPVGGLPIQFYSFSQKSYDLKSNTFMTIHKQRCEDHQTIGLKYPSKDTWDKYALLPRKDYYEISIRDVDGNTYKYWPNGLIMSYFKLLWYRLKLRKWKFNETVHMSK